MFRMGWGGDDRVQFWGAGVFKTKEQGKSLSNVHSNQLGFFTGNIIDLH